MNSQQWSTAFDRAALIVITITGVLLGASAQASALEPRTSTQVSRAAFQAFAYGTPSGSDNTLFVNIAQCRDAVRLDATVNVRFDTIFDISLASNLTGGFFFQGAYIFGFDRGQGTSPNCAETEGACTLLGEARTTRDMMGATIAVPFRTLTGFTSEQDCAATGQDKDFFIRLQLTNSLIFDQADVKLTLDLTRPNAPEDFDAVVTERGIRLSWVPNAMGAGDVARYQAIYKSQSFELPAFPDEVSGVSSAFVLANDNNVASTSASLVAGSTIWIGVAAVDEAGNPSLAIGPKSYEVIDTVDFWDRYKDAGGSETGGYCAHTSPVSPASGPWAFTLGMLGLCGLLRRRQRLTTTSSSPSSSQESP